MPAEKHEDNITAISLALRLASSIPDRGIKEQLCSLLGKMLNLLDTGFTPSIDHISEKISVKNVEYSRVDEKIFSQIVETLFKEHPVTILYYSPHRDEKTFRTILPLHLIHYMGNWHIVSFCMKRKDLRDFALSRIRSVSRTTDEVSLPPNLPDIKTHIRKNFGIIHGGTAKKVCLRFSPVVAAWVNEQVWHPEQETSFESDGSLIMKLQAADFMELKRNILSHGSDVKVIYPEELAEEIREEIAMMGKIY